MFRKNWSNYWKQSKLEGDTYLGWRQDSFVANKDDYSYRLSIPLEKDLDTFLTIWIEQKADTPFPIIVKEKIKRFKLSRFSKLSKKLRDRIVLSTNTYLQNIKNEFLDYLSDGRRNTPRFCEIVNFSNSVRDYSEIFLISGNKYIFAQYCTSDKNPIYKYWLITNIGSVIDGHIAALPYITELESVPKVANTEDKVVSGKPFYDSKEKILSINWFAYGCGTLYRFRLKGDQFSLIDKRTNQISLNCSLEKRYSYIDPILYPKVYP